MATETLRPNAAGDEENIPLSTSGAGNHWADVDEAVKDDDTTRVYNTTTTWQRDLYNLPAHSVGSGTINSITVYGYFRRSTSQDQTSGKIAIKTGGTAYEGTAFDFALPDIYVIKSETWNTNPNTSAAWTWDEIDALQIGIVLRRSHSASGSSCSCTQLWIEVDYTPPVTEQTSSDIGAGVDAYVSLETGEAKTSSDVGAGAEGAPLPGATLTGSETGSGIEALIFRLLAGVDTGHGTEVAQVGGLFQDLFASERGWGYDSLAAKIEIPTKGGGMKLWT